MYLWHLTPGAPRSPYRVSPGEGVTLHIGTWIGEDQENRGWELLGQAREVLERAGATPETAPAAFEALYMAEGSDWFWWFGADQDSGNDDEFDDLFRTYQHGHHRHAGRLQPHPVAGGAPGWRGRNRRGRTRRRPAYLHPVTEWITLSGGKETSFRVLSESLLTYIAWRSQARTAK